MSGGVLSPPPFELFFVGASRFVGQHCTPTDLTHWVSTTHESASQLYFLTTDVLNCQEACSIINHLIPPFPHTPITPRHWRADGDNCVIGLTSHGMLAGAGCGITVSERLHTERAVNRSAASNSARPCSCDRRVCDTWWRRVRCASSKPDAAILAAAGTVMLRMWRATTLKGCYFLL